MARPEITVTTAKGRRIAMQRQRLPFVIHIG